MLPGIMNEARELVGFVRVRDPLGKRNPSKVHRYVTHTRISNKQKWLPSALRNIVSPNYFYLIIDFVSPVLQN